MSNENIDFSLNALNKLLPDSVGSKFELTEDRDGRSPVFLDVKLGQKVDLTKLSIPLVRRYLKKEVSWIKEKGSKSTDAKAKADADAKAKAAKAKADADAKAKAGKLAAKAASSKPAT